MYLFNFPVFNQHKHIHKTTRGEIEHQANNWLLPGHVTNWFPSINLHRLLTLH